MGMSVKVIQQHIGVVHAGEFRESPWRSEQEASMVNKPIAYARLVHLSPTGIDSWCRKRTGAPLPIVPLL